MITALYKDFTYLRTYLLT